MDSSSESEFRYDGGDVEGGGSGVAFIVGFVLGLIVLAMILMLIFTFAPGAIVWGMPDSKLWWILNNYTVTYDSAKYTRTVKDPEVVVPTKAVAENLSVIWKDKMLSSGSDSAWGKSMYRSEGMCGQC